MKKVINVPVREGKITGSPVVPSFFASSCVNFEDASIGKKSPSKSGSWGFHSADREKGRKKTKQREKRKKRPKRAKNKKISSSLSSSSSNSRGSKHTALIYY